MKAVSKQFDTAFFYSMPGSLKKRNSLFVFLLKDLLIFFRSLVLLLSVFSGS